MITFTREQNEKSPHAFGEFPSDKKSLIDALTSADAQELMIKADAARKDFCGDEIFIRGIIEFSNVCARNCRYCGLRRDNKRITRYRMTVPEILEAAAALAQEGIQTVVLQSGDDLGYSRNTLSDLIETIKAKFPGMAVTLSVGERPLDDYRAFKDAGADRYLLKHETIDENLYSRLHPGQSLKHRLRILAHLKKLGYQVGIGNIIGLPLQTTEDLADELIFFKDFKPDMIGISPFIAQQDTFLNHFPSPSQGLVLKFLALTRLMVCRALMPSATAIGTLYGADGCLQALRAGCNVIMLNYTPLRYRADYAIYDNKKALGLREARTIISSAGSKISFSRGDSFCLPSGRLPA